MCGVDRISTSSPTPAARGLTRRRLVQFGALGAASAWLGGFERLGGFALAAGAKPPLRRSSYASLSSRSFVATANGAAQTLELAAVEDLPVAASIASLRGDDDAFRLAFRGASGAAIEQGTVVLSHPELGEFSLFVVPGDDDAEGRLYDAIIDRTVRITDEDAAPGAGDAPRTRGDALAGARRRKRRRHRHHTR
jgi:hypothetical protein